MSYTLFPQQEKVLDKLYTMRSAVIALMPGNGKTLVSLHLAKYLQEKEAVTTIFCIPKSARAAFEKELKNKLEVPYLMINSDNPLGDTESFYKSSLF